MVKAQAVDTFDKAMNLALQGDMKAALPLFTGLPVEALPADHAQAVRLLLTRFDGSSKAPVAVDPLMAKVLVAYQTYWKKVMLGLITPEAGERDLFADLAPLVQDGARLAEAGVGALEPILQVRLLERGCHALFGFTRPFRECMLWTSEQERSYAIELPEGHEDVRVVMLDGFISLGWTGFATGNYYHTGGWSRPDRLYCVAPSYDTASESFKVSYLAHEGQHFSDHRRFPALEGPELEYRAKLAELILADTTQWTLLHTFSTNTSDSRNLPHSYANGLVLRNLARILAQHEPLAGAWWETQKPSTIREGAVRLLEEDSACRAQGKGIPNRLAESTRGFESRSASIFWNGSPMLPSLGSS